MTEPRVRKQGGLSDSPPGLAAPPDPELDRYSRTEAKGFGKSVIGGLFAKVYSKSLDRAIPLLVEEMNASRV